MDLITDLPSFLADLPLAALVGGGLAAAIAVILQLARLRSVLIIIAVVFLFSSIATTNGASGRDQWLHPIQASRSPLVLMTSVLLFVGIFGHTSRFLGRPWPLQSMILLFIGVYAGMLRMVHDGPGSGISSIVLAIVQLVPLIVIISGLVGKWGDLLSLLRMVGFSLIVWTGGVVVQYLVNPSALTLGNQFRFRGLTVNPQHAAVYLGMTVAITLWLVLNDPKRRLRLVWGGMTAAGLLMLAWSGSRTGAGIFAIAAAVAFYGRIGRSIFIMPAVIVVILVGNVVLSSLGIEVSNASRLTSLEDTRSSSWFAMLDTWRSSPVIGVGVDATPRSENSYLYGMASYGIGMGILMGLLVVVSFVNVMRLIRLRWRASSQVRGVIDLTIAFNGMYFAGAVLEGYLLARVSATLVLFSIFAGVGHRILWAARHDPQWLVAAGEEEHLGDDEAWDDEAEDDEVEGAWDHADGAGPATDAEPRTPDAPDPHMPHWPRGGVPDPGH
ncbi:MAG: O-antigen ligase family protein [Phycisphaerales bacterium]